MTRKPGEEFLPVNVQPTFKSGRNSIMLWGCIAHGWKGPLIRLELGEKHGDKAQGGKGKGGLTGTQYVKQVMEGPLWASYNHLTAEQGPGIMVVEDGAPAHTSQVAKDARRHLGYRTLTHPPNSPNLNPIKPVWVLLKNKVADIPGSRNSVEKLWEAAQQVWDALTVEEIWAAAGSMPDRVAAVQAAKGFHTSF